MLTRHYAPSTITYLTDDIMSLVKLFHHKKIGVLLFKNEIFNPDIIQQEILSKKGN
jgi:L-threonylcarbamoyladenylate synthase